MTPTAHRVGDLVGAKYRLLRFVAEGGMGVVYEAQHTVVKRRFAVKLLRPELARRRDILTRFQREAEAAGALESENVAAAVDFGLDDDGTPYIVMEYLVGESLASLLERERRLPAARATDICLQASRGVEAAHASGIVHRDLKPQNLFVARRDDGTDLVKVLDFGVAKLQALDEMSAATRTGTVLGTAAYMSPEQARGDKTIDHRADVYALGAILYELLSGKRPHPGDSHHAILHHISTQPAVPLASVQAELPELLVGIVERALASDPNARPTSAEAFGQSIAPFARRETWPAGRGDDSGRLRGEVSSTLLAPARRPADAGPRSTERAPRRPRRAAWLATAGGGAAALALVIGILARGQTPRAHPLPPSPVAMPARTANGALPAPARAETAPAPEPRAAPPPPGPATDGDAVRAPAEANRRSMRARKPHSRIPDSDVSESVGIQPGPRAVHFDQDNPYQ